MRYMLFKGFSLTQRLSLVFALLMLACCGASAWLQLNTNQRYQQELVQHLSRGLAAHIASSQHLLDRSGFNSDAVHSLFSQLMAVNPAVEVYLLDADGRIVADAAPAGHVKLRQVDLAPVQRFMAGDALPITGDDPRSPNARKVFSAAPIEIDHAMQGYVYVVLQGEAHDALASSASSNVVLSTALWTIALVGLVGLLAGLAAFALITRPLRELTQEVRSFDSEGTAAAALYRASDANERGNEIAVLRHAFAQMGQRIAGQWRELTMQDQQRRDLVANISHDLRTPLTSLHGYLETLRLKEDSQPLAERQRYLDIALAQSQKVGGLAQALFELARLESGLVQPNIEAFSLPELVQDVQQKLELGAEVRQQRVLSTYPRDLPFVMADLGMIERVLTNLIDNAIRHCPTGSTIEVQLERVPAATSASADAAPGIRVRVHDDGPGITEPLRTGLFTRVSPFKQGKAGSGGLGLIIVSRILLLHGSQVQLADATTHAGAVFEFVLPACSGVA